MLKIRFARVEDAEAILRVHYSAVRTTASQDYPPEILAEWSAEVSSERITRYINESFPHETTLVACVDDVIAGFGVIVESADELRAVYVSPRFARTGIGAALLGVLERLAQERGCRELHMDSSLTARAFYLKHGFTELELGHHTLNSGRKMACVKMRKILF